MPEVLNKCLWRLQQPLWSRVGSLSVGLGNQRDREAQIGRPRQKETERLLHPGGPGSSLGSLLPAKATLGPVLLHPVFGNWGLQLSAISAGLSLMG